MKRYITFLFQRVTWGMYNIGLQCLATSYLWMPAWTKLEGLTGFEPLILHRVARWLYPKYRTPAVKLSVAQNIEPFAHV